MVQPIQSSHFEFYEDGSGKVVTPLRESALYLEDRLGLKVCNFVLILQTLYYQVTYYVVLLIVTFVLNFSPS